MVIEDLVVEDRAVECETKTDRVAGAKLFVGDVRGLLVEVLGAGFGLIEFAALGAFRDVAVIIRDHFEEESLALVLSSDLHALVLDHVDDLHALVIELTFNLGLVGS